MFVHYPDTTATDELDNNPRPARYEDILRDGLIRRLSEIFIVDIKNKTVLLTMRSFSVAVSPNTWTVSVGESVDWGETYQESATRGLKEELGITTTNIEKLDKVYTEALQNKEPNARTIKSWSAIFVMPYDDEEITIDQAEVAYFKWFTLAEVDQLLIDKPELISHRFHQTWPAVQKKLQHYVSSRHNKT